MESNKKSTGIIRKIKFEFAVKTLIVSLSLVIVYHFLILAGIIPYQYVWGGRLENKEQMWAFESVSILINLLIILIVAIKGNYIKSFVSGGVITVLLWVFVVLFALNTVGNLFSLNSLETIIFTPVTAIFSLLLLRLAIDS